MNEASLFDLRNVLGDYLGCSMGIFLDGSGSSQYRHKDSTGQIITNGGSDSPPRHIWNMVQITNVN
jgi:hypothetical protein